MTLAAKIPFLGFELEKNRPILEVRASGKTLNYKPNPTIHRHAHHEIVVVKKGMGKKFIDFNEIDLVDNQVFFLRPGQVHQFLPHDDAEFYFVAIDNEEVQLNSRVKLNDFEYFQSFYSPGHVVFDEVDSLIQDIHVLQSELSVKDSSINKDVLICSYLTIFLVKLQRAFLSVTRRTLDMSVNSDIVIGFNQLIDRPEFLKRFVKNYADKLHVSANYLNEKVKTETGKPASFWINQKLITESKRLLIQTSASIKEITFKLGFSHSTHFTRFFKQQVGTTPLLFKRDLILSRD